MMRVYARSDATQGIEDWPPPAQRAGNRLLQGEPRASGRIDLAADDGRRTLGIWRCTPGVYECIEQADELQVILEGRVRLVGADGSEHMLGPGDTVFTREGECLVWDVRETVSKVFYAVRSSATGTEGA